MDLCLRVLKESNKSRFDSNSVRELCIDNIPYYLSGLSRAHFFRHLSRNNCIQLHIKYPRCEHNTILCQYPGTSAQVPSVNRA